MAGDVFRYLLRRLLCEICGKLHTEIPDIIQPYKHYDSETIQGVLDGSAAATVCAADDSTIRRWKKDFAEAAPDISQRLSSVYARMTDAKPAVLTAERVLGRIRSGDPRWLAFVFSLLINGGHKLRARFAFCPSPVPDKVEETGKKTGEGSEKIDQTIKDTG